MLADLDADPARLTAVADVCRAKADLRVSHALAAELADTALANLHQAGADRDPKARARLITDLNPKWQPTPYRQGLWHRHSLPRRLLRRLDPGWWYGRWRAAREVQMVYHPATEGPADYHEIELMTDARQVGSLEYKLCRSCQIGYVAKIWIDEDEQGKGLGTRVLAEARRQAPGYVWWTSGQDATAKTFWRQISGRTGAGYRFANHSVCTHMKE